MDKAEKIKQLEQIILRQNEIMDNLERITEILFTANWMDDITSVDMIEAEGLYLHLEVINKKGIKIFNHVNSLFGEEK